MIELQHPVGGIIFLTLLFIFYFVCYSFMLPEKVRIGGLFHWMHRFTESVELIKTLNIVKNLEILSVLYQEILLTDYNEI